MWIYMGYSGEDVEKSVEKVLQEKSEGLSFEELREVLDSLGIYTDGVSLRRILVNMIKKRRICKSVSLERRKMLLRLCK